MTMRFFLVQILAALIDWNIAHVRYALPWQWRKSFN